MRQEASEMNIPKHANWGKGKRFWTGLNVSASLVLAITAVIALNYLSATYFHVRRDISHDQLFTLSKKTEQILSKLQGDISAHVVFRVDSLEKEDTVRDIMRLLEAYRIAVRKAGPHTLTIERIDPDRDLARLEVLRQKCDLRNTDVVVLESGGHSKSVSGRNIVKYDYAMSAAGDSVRKTKTAFLGEQSFSSAILGLTEPRKPVVYFVMGHGEHDSANTSKGLGYSDIAARIRSENIDVRPVFLTDAACIPPDADLLVIAGPRKVFSKPEIAALGTHLRSNHSLMLLLDAGQKCGLEPLMEEWGVGLPFEKVIEKTIVLSVGQNGVTLPNTGEEIYVRHFGPHPITSGLADLTAVFYLPRPVRPMEPRQTGPDGRDDKPRVTAIAACSENGWAETDMTQEPPTFDPTSDSRGPVPIAVAVERGLTSSVNAEIRPTRLVVMGDSDFAANGASCGANEEIFANAINWLLERDALVTVGPKSYGTQPLIMDQRQTTSVFMALVIIIPALVALLGIVVWLRRSR